MDFEYKLMLIAKDAREEGFEEGYKEGFEEGRMEVRLSNYSSLVRDGISTVSGIMSRRTGIWSFGTAQRRCSSTPTEPGMISFRS